jgi:hypothetical protein
MSESHPPDRQSIVVKFTNDQAALAARVTRLESILIGFAAGVCMLCLVLGELLPAFTFSQNDQPITASLAAFGFRGVTYRQEDGSSDGSSMFIGIAFIGLLVVVLASLATLMIIGRRAGDLGSRRWAGITTTLLVIGVVGVWLTTAVGNRDPEFELHQGPLWLTAGAALTAVLVWSETVRELCGYVAAEPLRHLDGRVAARPRAAKLVLVR